MKLDEDRKEGLNWRNLIQKVEESHPRNLYDERLVEMRALFPLAEPDALN